MRDVVTPSQVTSLKAKKQKIRSSLSYCEKVLEVYAAMDTDEFNQEELLNRVVTKLRSSYFS